MGSPDDPGDDQEVFLRRRCGERLEGGKPDPLKRRIQGKRLEPDGKRTKVILTQSNLRGGVKPADVDKRAEYEKNWTMVLENLDKVVGSKS